MPLVPITDNVMYGLRLAIETCPLPRCQLENPGHPCTQLQAISDAYAWLNAIDAAGTLPPVRADPCHRSATAR